MKQCHGVYVFAQMELGDLRRKKIERKKMFVDTYTLQPHSLCFSHIIIFVVVERVNALVVGEDIERQQLLTCQIDNHLYSYSYKKTKE